MVAEAQSNLNSPEPLSNPLDSAEPPLRATALWLPTPPPVGLCLNDASYVRMSQSMSGIQHMTWVLFGGCGGEHLPNLTGVTATQYCIEFHHDSYVSQDQMLMIRSTQCTHRYEHFPIDGKGGERIIALAAGSVYHKDESGFAFEITTNRGRSFQFGVVGPESSLVLKPLSVAHGTTIVGFFICHMKWYAPQVSNYQEHLNPDPGVTGFGVISAKEGV